MINLKEELAQVQVEPYPINPWANIQSWIAKATPVIRHDWEIFISDFREVTAEPSWPKIAGVIGESLNRSRWEAKKATTENAKQAILSFLNGLLTVATADEASASTSSSEFLTDLKKTHQSDIQTLILCHRRRLQKLKEQNAKLGVNTPAEILIEIEDKEVEIENLETELKQIRKETFSPTPD